MKGRPDFGIPPLPPNARRIGRHPREERRADRIEQALEAAMFLIGVLLLLAAALPLLPTAQVLASMP